MTQKEYLYALNEKVEQIEKCVTKLNTEIARQIAVIDKLTAEVKKAAPKKEA